MAQIISKKHVPLGERRGPSGGKPPVMALTKSKAKTAAPTLSLPLDKSPAWAHTHAGGVPNGGVSPASASEGGLLLVPLSDRGRTGGGNDEHRHQQQLLGAWDQRFGEDIVQALLHVMKAKRYLVSDFERGMPPHCSVGPVADKIGEVEEEAYVGAGRTCSSLTVKSFDSTYDLPRSLSSLASPSSSLSPLSRGLGLERLAATEISCVTFDTNKVVNDHSGMANNVGYTYGQVTTPSPSLPSWTNASASGGSLSASAARNAPAPPPPPPSVATASPSSYHHHHTQHGVFPAVFASPPLTSVAGPTAQFPSSAPTQTMTTTTRHEERILLPADGAVGVGLLASPQSKDKQRDDGCGMIVPTPQNVVLSTTRGTGVNTSVFVFQKIILTSRRLRPVVSEVFESLLIEKSNVNSREGGGGEEGMGMVGGVQYPSSSSRASSSLSARSAAKASSSVASPQSSASHSIARMQAAGGGGDHPPNIGGSYPQSEERRGEGLTPSPTSKSQSPSRAALYAYDHHLDRSEIIGGDHTSFCRPPGAGGIGAGSAALHGSFALNAHAPDADRLSDGRINRAGVFANEEEVFKTAVRLIERFHEEGVVGCIEDELLVDPSCWYQKDEDEGEEDATHCCSFANVGGVWLPLSTLPRLAAEGYIAIVRHAFAVSVEPSEGVTSASDLTHYSARAWRPVRTPKRTAAVHNKRNDGNLKNGDARSGHWKVCDEIGGEDERDHHNRGMAELALVRVPIENKGSCCSDERRTNGETSSPPVATKSFQIVALDLFRVCEGSTMGPIPCLHLKLQSISKPHADEDSRLSTFVTPSPLLPPQQRDLSPTSSPYLLPSLNNNGTSPHPCALLADELWSLYNSFALSELDEASLEALILSSSVDDEEEEGDREKNRHQQLQQHVPDKVKLIPASNTLPPPHSHSQQQYHHLASCGLEDESKGQPKRSSADLHVGGDMQTVPSSFPIVGPPPQPSNARERYSPPLARHSHIGTCLSPLDDDLQVKQQGLSPTSSTFAANLEHMRAEREAVISDAVRRYRIPNPPACGAFFLPDGSVLGWGRTIGLSNETESESEVAHCLSKIKEGDEDHVVGNGLVTGVGRTVVDGALPAVTTTTSSSGSTHNGDGRYRAGAGVGAGVGVGVGVGDFVFESDEDTDRGYGNDGGSSTTPTTALYLRTSTMSPLGTPTLVREPPPASAFERAEEDDYSATAVSHPPTRLLMPAAQIDLRGRAEAETSEEPLTLYHSLETMGVHNNKEEEEGGPLPSAARHSQGTMKSSPKSGHSGAFEYLFASNSAPSQANSGGSATQQLYSPTASCGGSATVGRQGPPIPTILGGSSVGGLFPSGVLDSVELCPREHNNTISSLDESDCSHNSRSLLYSNGMICAKTFFVLTSNSSDGGPNPSSPCDRNGRPSIAACPYLSRRNCHHNHQATQHHQRGVYSAKGSIEGQEEEAGSRKGRGDAHHSHHQNKKNNNKSKRAHERRANLFGTAAPHHHMDMFPLLHHFPSFAGGALPMFFQTLASASMPQTMPMPTSFVSSAPPTRNGEDREEGGGGASLWPGVSAATAIVEHTFTIVVPLMSEMTTLTIAPFLAQSPTTGGSSNLYLLGQVYDVQQQGSRGGGGGQRESIYFWLGVAVCNVCLPLVTALRTLQRPVNEYDQNDLKPSKPREQQQEPVAAVLSVGSFYTLIRKYFSKPCYIAALTTVWRVYSGASAGSSESVSASTDAYSRRSREVLVLLAHFRAALGHKDWIVQRSISASFGKNRHPNSRIGLLYERVRAVEQPSLSFAHASLFCVICCLPCIQGSPVMICRVCGHGGHAEHIMAWRGVYVEGSGQGAHGSQPKRSHSICATGCGCDCVY